MSCGLDRGAVQAAVHVYFDAILRDGLPPCPLHMPLYDCGWFGNETCGMHATYLELFASRPAAQLLPRAISPGAVLRSG